MHNNQKINSSVLRWDPRSSVDDLTRSLAQSNYFSTVKRKLRYLPSTQILTAPAPNRGGMERVTTSTGTEQTYKPTNAKDDKVKESFTQRIRRCRAVIDRSEDRIRTSKVLTLQKYIRTTEQRDRQRRTVLLHRQQKERIQYERKERQFRHELYMTQLKNEYDHRHRAADTYRLSMNQIIELDAVEWTVLRVIEASGHGNVRSVDKQFI